MMRPLAGLLLLGVLCGLAGCGTLSAQPRSDASTVRALLAAGDPDSLEAAALLQAWHGQPERQLEWLRTAAAAAPDRPDLVWLELSTCDRVVGCELAPLQAQLHWLDPDNGAPWSVALSSERKTRPVAAYDEDILAISYSMRFDIYWNMTIAHATGALIRLHRLDARDALEQIVGPAATVQIPPFHPLIAACRRDQLGDAMTLSTCRRLAAVLRAGDANITEMAGLGIAMRAWPDGSDERNEAVRTLRAYHYLADQEFRRGVARTTTDQEAAAYLQLLATHRAEREAFAADLAQAGVATDPPADWVEPAMWSR
jgi:hypothetical protein